jgi:hypothetical protein
MENIWPIILVGVIAAIAGYVFGMIDSRVTTALKEGREKIAESEEAKAAAEKLDEHNVLKVTVDPALKWRLELDGIHIEPNGLSAEQRTRLVNVLVQIRPWIDGKTVSSPVPNTPAIEAAPLPDSVPLQPAPQPSSTAIGTQPAAAAPAGSPRLDFVRGFRSLLENDVKKPEPLKVPSIVGLIDDVLQKKLENSPLSGKKIRLEEGSVGEVVVYVGAVRYSGIDAVPDENIKAIIKEAIAEWDKK